MADAPDLMSIGCQCAVPTCRQNDFLPFICAACQDTFCLEHFRQAAHACSARGAEATAVVCPLCALAIKLCADEDPNAAFEKHTREACDPANYLKVHKRPRCPATGCREKLTTINTYRCKECGATVCLRHRFASSHQCAGRAAPAAAASAAASLRGMLGWGGSASSGAPRAAAAAAAARSRASGQKAAASGAAAGAGAAATAPAGGAREWRRRRRTGEVL
ncbi:hypothetical protein WJX81_000236 [Elliptochloris bilobata]|uniref:AN1-type domain-containing protein n=1 Tax=Elliptochloris bilobata TaxID=381761 RepID=A0AAW1SJ63_9CHLO